MLHITGFKSEGFDPANKYVFLVGSIDRNTVLAFVITTQEWNVKIRPKEVVVLEAQKTGFPPRKSYIQCFELHRLDINDLSADAARKRVDNCGNLGKAVLQKVLDVVSDSDLLAQRDIQLVFEVLKDL